MRLTLKVHTYCDQPPIDAQQRHFDTFPVTLGRSDPCDYCLDDASRYISSKHAVITLEAGQLIIRDTSSNGLYINGSLDPVGNGHSQPLRHDDKLAIGDYTLVAAIESSSSIAPPNQDDDLFPDFASSPTKAVLPVPTHGIDPFGTDETDWTPSSAQTDDSFPEDWNPIESPDSRHVMPAQSDDDDWANWTGELAAEPPAKSTTGHTPPLATGSTRAAARTPFPVPPAPGNALQQKTLECSGALAALCKAADVRASDFDQRSEAEVLEQTGKLLVQMVDAMMVLLQSRSELKDAIRADVTKLSRSDNNPLKFSFSASDALSKMLAARNEGYMCADRAVEEAVDDLKLHQVAMLEGMKSAVNAILLQFNPERLAKKLEKTGGIAANIPITREAKLWELFCEQYDTIHEEAINDFDDLYGAEFRKAYEKSIRKTGRTPNF